MDGVLQLIGFKSNPHHEWPIRKRESCHLRPQLKVTIADGVEFLLLLCVSSLTVNAFHCLSPTISIVPSLICTPHFSSLLLHHWLFLMLHLSMFNPPLLLPFFSSTSFALYLTSLSQSFTLFPGCLISPLLV